MRELPPEWRPAPAGEPTPYDPWDTAYSLWIIAAVLFGIAVCFGGEILLGQTV